MNLKLRKWILGAALLFIGASCKVDKLVEPAVIEICAFDSTLVILPDSSYYEFRCVPVA